MGDKFNYVSNSTATEFARFVIEKKGEECYQKIMNDISYLNDNKATFAFLGENEKYHLMSIGITNLELFKAPLSHIENISKSNLITNSYK